MKPAISCLVANFASAKFSADNFKVPVEDYMYHNHVQVFSFQSQQFLCNSQLFKTKWLVSVV